MNTTHPELVAALVKPPLDIIQKLSAFTADLWHGATGVSGEAGELLEALLAPADKLDRVNIVEELGDLEFYMEQIRQRVGFTRDDSATARHLEITPDMLVVHGARIAVHAAVVLDTVKKAAVYNKDIDFEMLRVAMRELDRSMDAVRLSLGITRDETLAANMAKLAKRYKSLTYSDEAAQQRADKVPPRKFFGKGDHNV